MCSTSPPSAAAVPSGCGGGRLRSRKAERGVPPADRYGVPPMARLSSMASFFRVRHGRRAHRQRQPYHWRRARGQTPSSTLRLACRWCPTPLTPHTGLRVRTFSRSRPLLARCHRQRRGARRRVHDHRAGLLAGGLEPRRARVRDLRRRPRADARAQPAAAAPRARAAAGADGVRAPDRPARARPPARGRPAATPRRPSSPPRSTTCSTGSRPSAATASAARSPRRRASGCGSRRSSTTASARPSPASCCSSAASPATCPSRGCAGVTEAQETARDSLEEVRRIARRLRPEALDDLGLASALLVLGRSRGRALRARASTCTCSPALPEFSAEEELVLYRVAQEALTNVARHAGAKRAEVRLELAGGRTAAGDRRRRPRAPARRPRGRRRARHARARGADRRHAEARRAVRWAAHASPWSSHA